MQCNNTCCHWSPTVRYLPIFMDLDRRPIVVVGGDERAAQKLRLLVKTDAAITVIATQINREIAALVTAGRLSHVARPFAPALVDGATLVFAAGEDEAVNAEVSAAARQRAIPVNVVDAPAGSSFIMPAIVDRAPVTVAIGTEGAAPILAREIRARLESWLPANYGRVAASAGHLRERVKAAVPSFDQRRRLWDRLLTGAFRRHVLAGNDAAAAQAAEQEIGRAARAEPAIGAVALIGCGPGDPDLVTLKAFQRLQEADVLVIDRLVNPAILDFARRDATRIFVGKSPDKTLGEPSAKQDDINRILVREALKGHRVARLKGGDAFVFGRAAEEMAAVRAAGIAVEVIPGVTAAHACAAEIGLPLTVRGRIRQFSLVTGALEEGDPNFDWEALAQPGQAFAVYMGVKTAPMISAKLLAAGARPSTPVIVVENGTLPGSRTIATNLALLPSVIEAKGVHAPAIVFVGLDWATAHLSRPSHVEDGVRAAPREAVAVEAARANARLTGPDVALSTYWVAG